MTEEWLPSLVLLEDFGGDFPSYLTELYRIFERDFIETKPVWPGKKFGLKKYPETQGMPSTFWHFIQTGEREDERIPDLRRCERICWPRKLIDEYVQNLADNSGIAGNVRWWKETRNNEPRYILSTHDYSYITVIAERSTYVLPWTAYCIEHSHARRKNQRKFENFWSP